MYLLSLSLFRRGASELMHSSFGKIFLPRALVYECGTVRAGSVTERENTYEWLHHEAFSMAQQLISVEQLFSSFYLLHIKILATGQIGKT